MALLIQMLVPALLLSGLAVACLRGLPDAPARLRFAIAGAGLATWAIPWPWIELPFAVPGAAGIAESLPAVMRGAFAPTVLGVPDVTPATTAYGLGLGGTVGVVMAALVALGLARLAGDWRDFLRTRRAWLARGRSGEALRVLLPQAIRGTRVRIHVVPGTRVAATSGVLMPTIWIGDAFPTKAQLRLALIHECVHVRSHDALWTGALVAIARVYWWNPIVRCLAADALLMLESACDRRCMQWIGPRRYVAGLAAMILDRASTSASTLAPAARGRNLSFDLARLEGLTRPVGLRARDKALAAMLALAGMAVMAVAVSGAAEPASRPLWPEWSAVEIPETPAGRALVRLLDAFNGGDFEQVAIELGAYTPQQVTFPMSRGERIRMLDVVSSEPLSISYLASTAGNRDVRLGTLEVADADASVITMAELRAAPP